MKVIKTILNNISKILPDSIHIRLKYFYRVKKFPNLKHPRTFNEKLQWLKLHDRNAVYTTMVDKYEVKQYVADIIGEEHVVPMLGVWNNFDEIDFDELPNQFVLKCAHNSSGLVICRDKSKLDFVKIEEEIRKAMKTNYYYYSREWPYKNVKPRIIAEKYMIDDATNGADSDTSLPVYKFFCFDGEPRIIQAIKNDKQPNETIDYFDIEWNRLDIRQNYPNSQTPLQKPSKLDKMIYIVTKLAKGKKNFIRVDLYLVNDAIYFSEYTFYSDGGFAKFYPKEWDYKLGEWIKLDRI